MIRQCSGIGTTILFKFPTLFIVNVFCHTGNTVILSTDDNTITFYEIYFQLDSINPTLYLCLCLDTSELPLSHQTSALALVILWQSICPATVLRLTDYGNVSIYFIPVLGDSDPTVSEQYSIRKQIHPIVHSEQATACSERCVSCIGQSRW